MRALRAFWRSMFDIRPEERARVFLMALYLFLVMFVHYVLKPVSRGMFLEKFDIDSLPHLYLLVAAVGGLMATLYTRAALRASLQWAVAWVTAVSALSFVGFWWAIQYQWKWLLYAFNLWANLYGVVVVAQCFLVAGNVFTSREAKRVYGAIGLGANIGAVVSSLFTSLLVKKVGARPLVLVCALLVVLGYAAFRLMLAQKGVSLKRARAAEAEEAQAHLADMFRAIGRHRHLQVIMGIITLIFVVDVLVDYQYNYAAKALMGGQISAFLANFNLYSGLLALALQVFVTTALVSRLGVGGTMLIMPATMAAAAVPVALAPSLMSTVGAALLEKASRYSFNRTGMELLYMPLPTDLRNRTKAFVDIAVDRMGRGLAAVLLIVVGRMGVKHPRHVALGVLGLAAVWVLLSRRAQKEYVATLRRRLQQRRLDLESVRVAVQDPTTLALLEEAAASPNARQATYALALLAEVPAYPFEPQLVKAAGSASSEVRAKAYELAVARGFPGLLDRALAEVESSALGQDGAVRPAVTYLLAVSPAAPQLARGFLQHANWVAGESTLEALAGQGELGREQVAPEWVSANAQAADPQRRRLAALALGVVGDEGTETLHHLLADPDPGVKTAACRAAGTLRNRLYLTALYGMLPDARLRAAAIDALASYGTRICGTLGDLIEDETVPLAIRRRLPRVLRRVAVQRSVDVLLHALGEPHPAVRTAVLRALNRLREIEPNLDYGPALVTRQILEEARHYSELNAAWTALRDQGEQRTAKRLLARSLEERLHTSVERLFRLLALRYPPKEIYAAYLAVRHRRPEQLAAAVDYLESTLDRELKRVLLPLLDTPAHLVERSRDLFGIETPDAAAAIRGLIASGDPWLAPCGMAAAAELKLRELAAEIEQAARGAGSEVARVARSAVAALA